jgi:isopentenyl-diphosphate delta-isomerase
MLQKEEVILVDASDNATGTMEKMEAHRLGLLHRAFSVFIFNSNDQLLLQQRALSKYHSAGLWTNTCCSHPRPGEETMAAAVRRLKEEMGIDVPLIYKTSFTYRTEFENGLSEHEFDHVYTGLYDGAPRINPEEANSYKWLSVQEIKEELQRHPEAFTSWFKIAMEKIF